MRTGVVPQTDQAHDRRSTTAAPPGQRIELSWSPPRVWRNHPLAPHPYWVETEVEVVLAGVVVDQLSWSTPLEAAEFLDYEVALDAKWQVLG